MEAEVIYTFQASRTWLFMLREGGTWSVPELAEACAMERDRFRMHLQRWSNSGRVIKRGAEFGITLDCKIPEGLTLREVLEAVPNRHHQQTGVTKHRGIGL